MRDQVLAHYATKRKREGEREIAVRRRGTREQEIERRNVQRDAMNSLRNKGDRLFSLALQLNSGTTVSPAKAARKSTRTHAHEVLEGTSSNAM